MFISAEAKKNVIQKRKKEKLPVDVTHSSEDTSPNKEEQGVATEMDVTHIQTADAEAGKALKFTQGVCIPDISRPD